MAAVAVLVSPRALRASIRRDAGRSEWSGRGVPVTSPSADTLAHFGPLTLRKVSPSVSPRTRPPTFAWYGASARALRRSKASVMKCSGSSLMIRIFTGAASHR